jgi:hypothetical protein
MRAQIRKTSIWDLALRRKETNADPKGTGRDADGFLPGEQEERIVTTRSAAADRGSLAIFWQ